MTTAGQAGPPEDMRIEVICEGCANALRIPARFAGKRVACPKCKAALSVPAVVLEPELEADQDLEIGLELAPRPQRTAPPRARTPRHDGGSRSRVAPRPSPGDQRKRHIRLVVIAAVVLGVSLSLDLGQAVMRVLHPHPELESAFAEIEPGMSQEELEERLGEPDKRDHRNNVETMAYASRDFAYTFYIMNGKLVAKRKISVADAKAVQQAGPIKAHGEDRDIIVHVDEVAAYIAPFAIDRSLVVLRREELERAYFVVHEYVPEDGVLMVECRSGETATPAMARLSYGVARETTQVNLASTGVRFLDDDSFFRWGDESSFTYVLDAAGNPCGCMFLARKDTKLFNLILVGVYFDDPVEFESLVARALAALDAR